MFMKGAGHQVNLGCNLQERINWWKVVNMLDLLAYYSTTVDDPEWSKKAVNDIKQIAFSQ